MLLHISGPDGDMAEKRLDERKRLLNGWPTTTHGGRECRPSSYIVDAGGKKMRRPDLGF